MATNEREHPSGVGGIRREAGDAISGFLFDRAGFQDDAFAREAENLAAVREIEIAIERRRNLKTPRFETAMALIDRLVYRKKNRSRRELRYRRARFFGCL